MTPYTITFIAGFVTGIMLWEITKSLAKVVYEHVEKVEYYWKHKEDKEIKKKYEEHKTKKIEESYY